MNRLRNLLFKMKRSGGDFQIHRHEEEEELFSVHIRRIFLVWIAVVAVTEMICEAFFYQVSGLYEPFMIFALVIAYHFLYLQGGKWILCGRILYLLFPEIMFVLPEYREGFFSLAREMEISLADQGLSWFHIEDYGEIGFGADFVIVCFLFWGVLLFYEIGKKQEWLLVLLPIFGSLWLFFMMDWNPGWWFYPLMIAESLLILMPSVAAWGVISGATLVIMIVLLFTLHSEGNEESGIWKAWQKWRYGVTQAALPEGNMRKASDMVRSDETALVIQTKSDNNYYLRGYIGNVYDGKDSWTNNRKTIRTLEPGIWGSTVDVVDILHEKGYYGSDRLTSHKNIKDLKSYYFLIDNIAANRKYLYLPYESKTDIADFITDGIAVNGAAETLYGTGVGGQDSYQCKAVLNLAGHTASVMENSSAMTSNKKTASYGQMSSAEIYQEYIRRIDLALSKSTKTMIAEALSSVPTVKNITPQGAYEAIRGWMKQNITYVENPSPIPEDEDFLRWFLYEEKAGNDVYIASCATMMFRYMGIPARYVEGYLFEPGVGTETKVLQSDAHAWVEIYVEELGWIPVEVTESYEGFTASYLPNYASVSETVGEMDTEEKEQDPSENTEEQEQENSPESQTEEENTAEDDSLPEEEGTESEKYNWESLVRFIIRTIGRIILIVCSIAVLGLFVYIVYKLIYHYMAEAKWKRSVQTGVCITEWYRHLMMHLYLLENVKDKSFEMWDNRNETVQEVLLKYDQSCAGITLNQNFAIYKKALFSEATVTWEERKQFVHFCEKEINKLKKLMTTKQKLQLIFAKEFH